MTTKTSSDKPGAFIIKVNTDGPASKAGMKLGDVLTKINGINVTSSSDIIKIIGYQLNKSYVFTVIKDKIPRELTIHT